jgi:putative phosphoesterase
MRLGLISDIHADLDNLTAALALLDGMGVDAILCAGDLIERGQGGDAVIALIRTREIPCVKGNHEHIALYKQESLARTGRPDGLGYRPLRLESIDFIRSLPDTDRFDANGQTVLLAHATPWDDFSYVYPLSRPELFRRIAREADADVVILGHTHVPMLARVGATVIVNPGSVSAAGSCTCAVHSLPECDFEVYSIPDGARITEFSRVNL